SRRRDPRGRGVRRSRRWDRGRWFGKRRTPSRTLAEKEHPRAFDARTHRGETRCRGRNRRKRNVLRTVVGEVRVTLLAPLAAISHRITDKHTVSKIIIDNR